MSSRILDRCIEAITGHNRLVILVMLALTGAMFVGMGNLDTSNQAGGGDIEETTPAQKADYIEEHYDDGDEGENVSVEPVYIRSEEGNALSKAALIESLEYQRAVRENESVAGALVEDEGHGGVSGVANLLAVRAAEDPEADLETQIEALESTDEDELEALIEETLTADSEALALLPSSYEPGSATAESHRMLFHFEANGVGGTPSDAQRVLYEEAADREEPNYFTLGEHAIGDLNEQMFGNTVTLVLPVALALILGILAFAYRDPVDVVVGMIGVVVSIVWMFGILGWLGVSAGMTMIIGPVLIAGLSIDFSFHVFMRYREERGTRGDADDAEGIRPPMTRSLRSVAIALVLVTVTTAIGFLSNVVNPVDSIRDMAIGITLGVIAACIVFVTLVPALKIGIDGLLERVGFDRRKRSLGHGTYLRRLLSGSVGLARRAAPVVIVVALIAGTAGAVAWPALDQESFQQQTEPVADWKTELPGPMAWEESAFVENQRYVSEQYRSSEDDGFGRSEILIEGDVTADDTLERVDHGAETGRENGVAFDQRGVDPVVSPVSVIESTAAENESFAATVEDADANGDGVPDSNLEDVYDHLFEVAPEEASQVIERTDDGEYATLRAIVTVDRSDTYDDRADGMQEAAAAIENGGGGGDGDGELTATAVGQATITQAQLGEITDGILYVLVLALGVIAVALIGIYRLTEGSASLGAVTVVPIVLVAGLVIGSMYVLDVPLTLLTALLMSLVIGLGIDYNIHLSDRFAHELERHEDVYDALEAAVVGTGGALLGSTLTSSAAFLALLLHPHPQFESLGLIVVLALVTSFLVSVFVLPSMLALWAQYADIGDLSGPAEPTAASTVDD